MDNKLAREILWRRVTGPVVVLVAVVEGVEAGAPSAGAVAVDGGTVKNLKT